MGLLGRKPVIFWVGGLAAIIGVILAFRLRPQDTVLPGPASYIHKPHTLPGQPAVTSIYADDFPASQRLKSELKYVRQIGRLQQENEALIGRVVIASSARFKMPPSVLWCLLFQESRLNHLQGIFDNSGARGLGQFSSFSFYEINHQLNHYYPESRDVWIELLGQDVRPVMPLPDRLVDPSSYFYIPTAVISSATFLNNRYHHLKKILTKHAIPYDPQILWLHALLAYNKGSRSVLALWKEARRSKQPNFERLFSDRQVFLAAIGQDKLLPRAFLRIWSPSKAKAYAREAHLHAQAVTECCMKAGKHE